jgi:hypothetical protein
VYTKNPKAVAALEAACFGAFAIFPAFSAVLFSFSAFLILRRSRLLLRQSEHGVE